jgi:hypothetical protein
MPDQPMMGMQHNSEGTMFEAEFDFGVSLPKPRIRHD